MAASYINRTTPGVYITELNAFPASIVGIQTAVPAFIGYTEQAIYQNKSNKSLIFQPTPISSLDDFTQFFGGGFKPTYQIKEVPATPLPVDYDISISAPDASTHYFKLTQKTPAIFYLYNSLRLFFANGGSTCYVLSVGLYQDTFHPQKNDLLSGLNAIAQQAGPTLLVIPEAVSVSTAEDYQAITQAMLAQCGLLQDRFALLDIYNAQDATTPEGLTQITEQFQNGAGNEYLSYGAAYFPNLETTIVSIDEFNCTNFDLADSATLKTLQTILGWQNKSVYKNEAFSKVQQLIDSLGTVQSPQEISALTQSLSHALPVFKTMLQTMVDQNSILSPSGAVAGAYAATDASKGVWNAPANVALNSVVKATLSMDDEQQGLLNVPLNGKAINVIRNFTDRGAVIWGARTLDGNSQDYRYIQVRRTLIYIEQSIKNALQAYVFSPNISNTWATVASTISSFLTGFWSQGGLMGSKPSDAFSVRCGLGNTMTGQDILNGYMLVSVSLQMIHPAEFIELTFTQLMQSN